MTQEILLIGFGNMGKALASGWVRAGIRADAIAVTDAVGESQREAAARGHVGIADTRGVEADIVVVAVKPQQLSECINQHRSVCKSAGVVLSIVAGKTLADYRAALAADASIVRAMPNTPAAIAEGVSVLCASPAVSARHKERCAELMRAVGHVHWVDDEALLDAVTALSGSGPAYVFLFVECLAAAGVAQGLPHELAQALALQTVTGAALYARSVDVALPELRRRVTSPGGTTEAALGALLEQNRFLDLIKTAVAAATERSRALSKH